MPPEHARGAGRLRPDCAYLSDLPTHRSEDQSARAVIMCMQDISFRASLQASVRSLIGSQLQRFVLHSESYSDPVNQANASRTVDRAACAD